MPISRRQFLSGAPKGETRHPFPPWAQPEQFALQCNRCMRCVTACPENLLTVMPDNLPGPDFNRGACTFCGACAEHCAPGALNTTESKSPWKLKAQLDRTNCLAWRGVDCRLCYDFCDQRAFSITYRPASVPLVEVQPEQCNGCGACVAPCPAKAIEMTQGAPI